MTGKASALSKALGKVAVERSGHLWGFTITDPCYTRQFDDLTYYEFLHTRAAETTFLALLYLGLPIIRHEEARARCYATEGSAVKRLNALAKLYGLTKSKKPNTNNNRFFKPKRIA